MRSGIPICLALILAACTPPAPETATPQILDQRDLAPEERRSGYMFLTKETQALQDDTFENPGYLWVDRGQVLFQSSEDGVSKPCATCHAECSLETTSALYTALDYASG